MDQKNKPVDSLTPKPWYKYRMTWLAFGLPATAVIASIITLVIAVNNAPIVIKQSESFKQKLVAKTKDN
ncbi:hypothetical protein MNBD_GAMMA01-549 [hydrothermal vent metagenome]|uniref:Nitrogen fixation protein FixH n=1 Tax=hydrothermal vent metagenome TaxID=652676 RepID=A0A3B0VSP9_9ZZZZ